jgi:hypothetical protein
MEVVHWERTFRMVGIRLTSEGRERVKLADAGKCLGCECPYGSKEVPTRGLCTACYQAARRAIRAGKVEENALVKSGQMLELGKQGRPLSNPLAKKLAER